MNISAAIPVATLFTFVFSFVKSFKHAFTLSDDTFPGRNAKN